MVINQKKFDKNITATATGARYFSRKYEKPKSRALPEPPEVNSSRTSSFFITQPTKITQRIPPMGRSMLQHNLSSQSKIPRFRAHRAPMTPVTANTSRVALPRFIFFSSISHATGTSTTVSYTHLTLPTKRIV